ncbi:hypothetical protein [Fodinicola acaciae]|uniref:hypothetical protein n=1 Tax=Fodinicola acaciae TaxID=2681555 RepID=UPI0013D5B6DF|nr:hypothetical protein [Fodinicola acaciae]
MVFTTATTLSLWFSSGWAAFSGSMTEAALKLVGGAGLQLVAQTYFNLRGGKKESKEFQAQRERGQDPEAEPMVELDRVAHEGQVRDRDLQTQLRQEGRQRATDMADVADAITELRDKQLTPADVQRMINDAVAQATTPLRQEVNQLRSELQQAKTELASQIATETYARQSADGHLQAEIGRVDSDLSERIEDTQVAANDLTRGLNDLNERHDTHVQVTNQNADAANYVFAHVNSHHQVLNAHAESIDEQAARTAAQPRRRGEPAPAPVRPAARATPHPPAPEAPGPATTVPRPPWGPHHAQQPEPFPTARRRTPAPTRQPAGGSPAPTPQPSRNPQPPRR